MSLPSTVDVAIVGAGPAGLATACMLQQNGVKIVVLDAATEPATGSRATVIHSRTLEVLEQLDLTKEIFKVGKIMTKWQLCDHDKILADLDFGKLRAKYPMVVSLPQSQTEGILREKFAKLGGTIVQGAHVGYATDSGDKVQLEVSLIGGTKATITAAYVVAADGLKSLIRQSLDIPFEGGEYDASFIATDVLLTTPENMSKDALQLYLAPGGFVLFVSLPNNVWRIVVTLEDAPKNADIALVQKVVDERAMSGIKIDKMMWTNRFHIHHRLAKQYRKGRIFLAGDAAHVHSPAGGQGMNIGVQDGLRLGQVLSEAVNNGKQSDEALDRYEKERRPKAQGVIAMTHRTTTVSTIRSPWFSWLRNWMIWLVYSIPWN